MTMAFPGKTEAAAKAGDEAARLLVGQRRWRWYEVAFWAAAVALYFVFGDYIPGVPTKLMLTTFPACRPS
jgi:hypothetical protein